MNRWLLSIRTAHVDRGLALFWLLACCMLTGCAAFTNPVANGIPVRRLPTELLSSPRREGLETVPLSMLRMRQPPEYLIGPGDVLGVFVPGIFPMTIEGQDLPTPPVNFPSRIDPIAAGLPPSMGYPFTVRSDGTLPLPLVDPIRVEGMTVEQAHDAIRRTFREKGLLQPSRDGVYLSLMQPRQIRVLVFRQEVGGFASGGRGDIATSSVKQGTGHIVDLRAYENDVLTALSLTGGLPGLDTYDSVFIFRSGMDKPHLTGALRGVAPEEIPAKAAELGVEVVRLPTRWPPNEPLPFGPQDVELAPGDVVFIESRTRDFFYTGGLLPRGEFQLPRDYDLDVVEAVAQVRGTLLNGAFGGNNLNGLLIQPGIGNPNPTSLTVIRRTPGGGQVAILVDLNRALKDPRERILVQPGDVLILQETRGEAFARYFTNVFNFGFISNVIQRSSTTGTTVLNVP